MHILDTIGWSLIWVIVVLGVMIFVHELGHYLMAKFLGIRVEVFSLGFGPRLVGFQKGDTDYRISGVPLGGYVKMKGENWDEDLTGSEDEFLSRPKLHRLAVAVAGPFMNVAMAVVLLAVIYMAGIQVPVYLSQPPIIGYVAGNSPAEDAGLQQGDRILSVGGTQTPDWESEQLAVATDPGQTVPIEILREGRTFERLVHIAEEPRTGAGFLGVYPPSKGLTVGGVEPDGPAQKAGLQKGDIIEAVQSQGTKVEDGTAILSMIAKSQGQALEFTIKRGRQTLTRTVTPMESDGKSMIGIAVGPSPEFETQTERYGPLTAFRQAVERNYQMTILTFRIVGKLITGETSIRMMSGPIDIARFSGEAASAGPLALIGLMSLISLQLGIFNLLPIPILDGGMIALLFIEAVIGRDLSLKAKERIFQVGFIFLILLMSVVIFNDIAKIM
ncbi:MAG: RIP metalloprotease RseP [Acidobacteriota bacterium]